MKDVQANTDNCKLKLHKIYAQNISFNRSDNYSEKNSKFDIKVGYEIADSEDKSKTKVNVKVEINDKEENALSIDVSLCGIFSMRPNNKENEKFFTKQSLAILFPYLRSLITTITAQAEIRPIVLPPINFNALIDEQYKNKENKNKK
ncbi:protein-export chaperone SecB [Clostridium ljungdahlii]|uniref:Protein-export protein SecB n=1 Tax=Clostridium ljungdahlii TaxID=1538 RepID=A0A162LB89_9CLOT|nr:protein-export chaperone SecB [Clostridium ljungdahlii]OAA91286.1 Protein-export protein SecB [Clostridium ljungdahlii]